MFRYIKIICITLMFIIVLDSVISSTNSSPNTWILALFAMFLIYIIITNAEYSNVLAKIERARGIYKYNKFFAPNKATTFENLLSTDSEETQDSDSRKIKKQKNAQTSYIMSILSNELKKPIAAILEQITLGELKQENINALQSQAQKLRSLCARLDLVERLEGEKLKLQKNVFGLDSMIEQITNEAKKQYPNKNAELHLRDVEIIADKELLEQALVNLIDNALKYSKQNVKITLKKSSIRIIDDGKGISKKDIAHITKKFYRAKHTEQSLGLGLFITKNILDLHAMDLRIKSKINEGTCFIIKVPKSMIVSSK